MFERLAGMETEYAIRFHSLSARTSNKDLYPRLVERLRERLPVLKDHLSGHFVANGGHCRYEGEISGNLSAAGGVLEGATPECRTPRQLLLYSRAMDAMLSRAISSVGSGGECLALIKNNCDAYGNLYGCHENYEATFASGLGLLLWRVFVVLALPLWIPMTAIGSIWIMLLWGAITIASWLHWCCAWGDAARHDEFVTRWYRRLLRVALVPFQCFGFPLQVFAFRRQRRLMEAFLVSRQIVTGSGAIDEDGNFRLSQRSSNVGQICGQDIEPSRPIFYVGNITKCLMLARFTSFFPARQRMQLAVGDSNMAQWAEYLKFGTTLLVLDAIEAGALTDAPRLSDPIEALHAINTDPTLEVEVSSQDGTRQSGLALQRYYLDACEKYIANEPVKNEEAAHVLALWRETLDALEHDRDSLIGRVDWVTKKHLLDHAGADAPMDSRRKIDIRYHELTREGYFLQMESVGLAPTIVEPEEVVTAMTEAPSNTRAAGRATLIRGLAGNKNATAGWDHFVVTEETRLRWIRLNPRADGKGATWTQLEILPAHFGYACLPIVFAIAGLIWGFQNNEPFRHRIACALVMAIFAGFGRMIVLGMKRDRFQRDVLHEGAIVVGTALSLMVLPFMLAEGWGENEILLLCVASGALISVAQRYTFGITLMEVLQGVLRLLGSTLIVMLYTGFVMSIPLSLQPGLLAASILFVYGTLLIPVMMWYARKGYFRQRTHS